jgi:NhaP-type Na+/H+ or K+/H+ antiporter
MSLELSLIVVLLGGYAAGKLSSRLGLPSVLGMTLFGLLIALLRAYLPSDGISPLLDDISPALKSLALVIILLRAGLGIHLRTLKKIGRSAFFLSFIPMIFEASWVAFISSRLFGWDPARSLLMGFLLAAVSPAVVVPSMLELKEQRRGEKNDVPTLVLAGASLDDVFAITLFTMVLGLIRDGGASLDMQRVLSAGGSMVISVILGILPGLILGLILVWLFRKHQQRIRATEKTLLLLGLSLALFSLGQVAHTAALLGVMTMGFLLLAYHPPAARELAAKLGKAWIFAEIILFVLIGMAVDIDVALEAGLRGLVIILSGLAFRSLGVMVSLLGSPLPLRERLFVMIAYFPKATVQAALGAVPLAAGVQGGRQMLAIAVLSILVTAPLGLIGIRGMGPRLLHQKIIPPQNSRPA